MSVIEECENLVKELEKASPEDVQPVCIKLGEDVMAAKIKLVRIVELLGPLLVNTDVKQREKGVTSLAEIMVSLKPDYLSEAELTFICAFFCDRMKDHHSLASAVLKGVLALIDMDNLPSDSPILLCTSLFSQIHCQTLTQPERNMVYRIFQSLLTYRIDDLKPLGIDFVLGFITAIDSERDPQNLMLLFSILPRFLTSFPLLHLAEEAFNVISCYFPIDFNAAGEDHQTNTREDLALALAPCLTAVPEFAEFCIPLLLEKLDSNLSIAKLDSLLVLKEGCKKWPVDSIEPSLIDIWLALKKELLPGSDGDVRSAAGETLVTLIWKLNGAAEDKKLTILSSFVEDIIASTIGLLSDMNLSLFGPAVHILVSASNASEFVCEKITSFVVPKLYALPQKSSQDTVIVIRTLNLFLKAHLKHSSNTPNNVDACGGVWSVLPKMLLSASTNDNNDIQAAAFEGLSTLAPHLPDSNRNLVYENCELALSKGNELVRSSCIKCLKVLAVLYPLEVMNNLVKSKLLIDKGCTDKDKEKWRVEALCSFLTLPEFTDSILNILLNFIEEYSPCTPIILHSIRLLLDNCDLDEPAVKVLCVLFTKRLVTWWLNGVVQMSKYIDIFEDDSVLLDSAAVVQSLIRPQNSRLQSEVITPLVTVIAPVEETGNGLNSLVNDNVESHVTSTRVVLLEGLLESVHQDVVIPNWQMLTTTLSSIAFNSNHYFAQLSASRLLATLMNKQQNDEWLATVLGHVARSLEERLKDKKTEVNAVTVLSWITKALVLRGHSLMSYWLDKLTDLLNNKRVGREAAAGFRLIMSEEYCHLSSSNHCTVRILYKQRLFQRIPTLVSGGRSCDKKCQVNYLLAIANFVQAVPRAVLLPYLRQVVLPMVESLDSGDVELQLITLETISSLLLEKEQSFENTMDTFLLRFMSLATSSPVMKVRIASLECVKYYAAYPAILLMPYVTNVIRQLEVCLDDKKRLVRKAAVDARTRWFLVGAPADDD